MNGKKHLLLGLFLGIVSFLVNRTYITLTLFLAGYTLVCEDNDWLFAVSFLSILTILYNLKIYGLV